MRPTQAPQSTELVCSSTLSAALLFFVFNLAFIFTPYWDSLPTEQLGWVAARLSIPLGILWAFCARGTFRVNIARREVLLLGLLMGVCLILDLRALLTDIPWRGDEDYHIMAAAPLALRLRPYLGIAALASAAYVGVNLFVSRAAWVSIGSMVALSLFALQPTLIFDYDRFDPLRYPYVSRFLAAMPILLSTFVTLHTPEGIYRVVPFVSAVLIAYLVGRHAAKADPVGAWLTGLFVFTTPLLLYYSSILYLELPAVLLMAIVAFHAEALLFDEVHEVLQHPAWVALVLIGFIKETALPFLAALLACRLVVQCARSVRGSKRWTSLLHEARVVCAVTVPLALYLVYRARGDQRPPGLIFGNVFIPVLYTTFAWSYVEQFGPLLILCAAGVACLVAARRYLTVSFLACAYVLDTALHFLDHTEYAGYSRFNLFVLPLALVAASAALERVRARSPRLVYAVLVLGIAGNVWLSPVNADGSKRPMWGNYLGDTSEHYYPYKRAVQWIRDNGLGDARIRFTGMTYRYYALSVLTPFPHQDEKVLEPSTDEGSSIELALKNAREDKFDVVVYQILGPTVPALTQTSGFRTAQVLTNQAHSLVIFRKAD